MAHTCAQWWLEAGTEQCSGCEAPRNFEALIYCAYCDQPFCTLCITQIYVEREMLCMECRPRRTSQG